MAELELGLGQTSLDVDLRKWETAIDLRIGRQFENLKKDMDLRIGRLSESYIYTTALSPGLVQALQLNLSEISYIYPTKPPFLLKWYSHVSVFNIRVKYGPSHITERGALL